VAASTIGTPENAAPPGESLGRRAVGAAQWRVLSSVLQALLQFGVGVALARLLAPADFGLAAMGTIVVALPTLILDFGLGFAVIQRQPLTERHLRASVTLGLLLGALLAGVLLLLAPIAGILMAAPRLPAILRAESLLFLFAGFGVTGRALLQRKLAFRQLALADLAGYSVGSGLVAVGLAIEGFGVWSLVIGALIQSALANALVVAMARPRFDLLLARQEAKELLGFGSFGAMNGAVGQVAYYGDNLVVGRLLGAPQLGLYARAFGLMMLPLGYIGNNLFSLMFAALAELRADRARFRQAYRMSLSFVTLAAGPVMAGMAVAAPYLIGVLYGPVWTGAVRPFQVFCAVGLFRVITLPAGAVTHATGRIDAELRRQIVYAIWVLVGAGVGSRWGVTGAALGVATAILFKYVAMGLLSSRIAGLSWRDFLGAQTPGMTVALLVFVVASLTRWAAESAGASQSNTLLAIIAASAAAMLTGMRLLPVGFRPEQLFQRLSSAAAPLPRVLRGPIDWALRSNV
jgi:PST family polysaccharide transporter